MLGMEPIQRLMSPEGRASMISEMTGQLDASYRQSMTAGLGGLSRSGVGAGAQSMLQTQMGSTRGMGHATANIKGTMAAAQAVGGILNPMHQQQASLISGKYAGSYALAGRKREGGFFDLLKSGAFNPISSTPAPPGGG